MKIKCIIVDDETPARELLASYVGRLPDFEITKQFENALEAFSFLQKSSIDLMFLDIQMPQMSGLELINSLHQTPRVVLTTAFREYAADGFDLNVLDYLVKPISFERFMKAIGKYHHYSSKTLVDESENNAFDEAYLFIKVNRDQVKVFLKDILYIESIKDYLRIITNERSFITYLRISYMQEKLPEDRFVRIHRSFIVSIKKVKAFRNDIVKIGDKELPVGRFYKKAFLGFFSKL
ncbi:MAG TPA: LytTR family DNA-binding domain-containing protein [Cyclobacteriaceae bacterium]